MTVNHDMNHDSEPRHLNHDMNHDSEPRHLNHNMNHDMNHDSEPQHLNHDEITSFAGGSRQRECTVLENFAWFLVSKTAEIAVLGLICVSQVTCLVAGFKKSAEIAILGLIHVSQENWKLFFVILVKYFIILSNLEVGNKYI